MPTNREEYFKAIKLENPYLNNVVIRSLLIVANSFDNDYKLTINFDEEIKNYDTYLSMLERVKNGEPYQYVIGKASFLGNDYYVDKNVLIPRQETEQLVLQTKELIKSKFINREIAICDMCTGSGIIGNELHKEFSKAKVYLTDISKEALEIAKKNTLSNSENLTFLLGSMVNPLIEKGIKLDVLVCNPPYIDKVEEIDKQVWEYEPHLALTAFPSTSLYEEIFANYKMIMKDKFLMAFEIGEDMEISLTNLINKYFDKIDFKFIKDIYGKIRFLFIEKD